MSVVPFHPPRQSARSPAASSSPSSRWIINGWIDQLLIVSTPLLAIPAVLAVYGLMGVKAETISLIVTAFFALGHHLPGLIRAYGDQELFERFRWRFVLAPPLIFLAAVPLQKDHEGAFRLIITFWATWHGLMQLYGFVRIYDAKVGSTSRATAYWDWLVCLCGFVTAQLFSPVRLSDMLSQWYSFGGATIAPAAVQAARWVCLAISVVVLAGFAVNYVVQLRRGPRPNPIKLLLLASGIGTWWLAVVAIENVLVGVALFDVCHDVQYLAIVWLFNCRRVSANPQIGRFMSYLFRRGMVLLYLGLIVAYGAIGLVPALVQDGTIATIFSGILATSTILHYYYDGFIWKVREKETQAGLGLAQSGTAQRVRAMAGGGMAHLLKWSPLVAVVAWVFATDVADPALTPARRSELERLYAQALTGTTALPKSAEEQSWLYSQFERAQVIAASVPGDKAMQLRSAILLANFGRHDEAVDRLERLVRARPEYCDAQAILGGIHLYRGNFDEAAARFETALAHAEAGAQRSALNIKLGEVYLRRQDPASAETRFDEAIREDPRVRETVEALRQGIDAASRKAG